MEILNIKVLKGPNYWSNYWKNLIVVEFDLKEYEELPTDLIKGFPEKLVKLIPSLINHRCSRNVEGGFIERLKEGTWLGHVLEHVALELQYLAGMPCGFGRTRPTHKKGVYYVIFSYEIEHAGYYAARAALKILKYLVKQKDYPYLEQDIKQLKKIAAQEGFGISTKALVSEASSRNIPITVLDPGSLVMLGYGARQKSILAALTSNTSCLGADIATNKHQTKEILSAAFVPVPKGLVVHNIKKLDRAFRELGFPIVIKPLNGNHGLGVTTNIHTKEKAIQAFKVAQKISRDIVVERFVTGFDFRFLVINYKVSAVAKRIPAFITGNGYSTIKELIDETNKDPKRGENHENILTTIKIDDVTLGILKEKNLDLDTILSFGEVVYLKDAANLSAGGTAVDITDNVHPQNMQLAERIARLLNLDVCGIDIVAERIDIPMDAENSAVIEVNAVPGLRMHLYSSEGKNRNVAKNIIDMLYPEGSQSRIPIIAVTGTNGKTTTVRLLSYFAARAGYQVGFSTTDGVSINNTIIAKGDCSGPKSAQAILRDPEVEFAILECARGGILRSGLGFDHCSISILTNISEDHLGLGGIETLEELARIKSVVPHSTLKEGFAILNADDDLVYAMKDDLKCNVALFSMQPNNPRIKQHTQNNGVAAYVENGFVVVNKDNSVTNLAKITEIPLTFNGTSRAMIQNILAAVLAGTLSNFKVKDMAQWLKDLTHFAEHFPGRMNLFVFGSLRVLVDYAHNAGAFIELKEYLREIKCKKKIGIVGTPGDRRPEDIRNVGFYSSQIFEEIIIRHDKDGRGRTNEEITTLFKEGIEQNKEARKVTVISDEQKALEFALENAGPDSFIVYCPEDVTKALNFLRKLEIQEKTLTDKGSYHA